MSTLIRKETSQLSLPGTVTAVSYRLPENTSFEEWQDIGKRIQRVADGVMWWLGDWWAFGEHRYGERASQFADPAEGEYKIQTLKDAGWVSRAIETSRRRDLLAWSHHREVAALDAEVQDKFLDAAIEHGLSVHALRKVINDYKLSLNAAQLNNTIHVTGTFSVLVVDPPWPMEKIQRDVRPNQAEFDYPVLSIEDIENYRFEDERRIPQLAETDCHFFLWTTQKFLPDALKLLEAWDFTYICTFTWHKPGGFQPYGLPQYNCEFALYARKGSPEFIDTKDFPLCFEAPRAEHSRKPARFYETIRRVTAGQRADIFSREPHEGFIQLGNEVEKYA